MSLQRFDFFPDEMSLLSPVASPTSVVQRIAARPSRQRGIVLTEHGWKKLLAMKVLQNQHGEWHAYELLGDRTLLSPRTVSKIVGREVGVDRHTLKQFFDAFDLPLESDDYCLKSCCTKKSSNPGYKAVAFVFHFQL
ncbi:hypothetical protein [Nostoc sp.]|uniref:hypothetical protein n=1 Tax=Nostoc sp. TaxID=1180 RepID=UPI002FFC82C9